LIAVLVLFFTSLELMGSSFKLMGKGVAEQLLKTTSNPFVGLFIGILATSLVQSSSTVTTLTVSIVAAGGLTISGAIPIVMGANIGTSVTNTIVSLGSVTRKEEFRRAMGAATVHDFFNFLAVGVFFPLELAFQVVSRPAAYLTDQLADVGGTQLLSPVKEITEPIANLLVGVTGPNGILVLGWDSRRCLYVRTGPREAATARFGVCGMHARVHKPGIEFRNSENRRTASGLRLRNRPIPGWDGEAVR